MFFVGVRLFLRHVKLIHLVHAFNFAFRPNALIIICLELGSRRCQPPQKIYAQSQSQIVEKVLLLSILFFNIVNVTLIVIYRSDLFGE